MRRLFLALMLTGAASAQTTLPPSVGPDFVWSFAGVTAGDCIRRNDANTAWVNLPSAECGAVVSSIDDLSDVTLGTPTTGEVLRYSGSAWVDAQLAFADLSGAATDGQVPDTITINLAATATALAADPADCGANVFARAIDAQGNLTCSGVSAGVVSNTPAGSIAATTVQAAVNELDTEKLALAGGTLTGSLVTSNLGVELTESDSNPGCVAGDYKIYADLSETTLKKCVDGSVSDLDTAGGGGAPTGAQYWVSAADGTLSAEVVVNSLATLETAIGATNILEAADIDSSLELANVLGDETGSGAAVFGASPTIVTPTIASFANAAHNHENAAGGGTLNLANLGGTLGTGQAATTFVLESDIGTGLAVSAGTVSFAPSEVGTSTWGAGSASTWTFDASAGTDCTFTHSDNALTWTCATFSVTGDLAVTGSITAGGSGSALEITEQAAPGAGGSAGVHNVYIDSTNSRWSTHENGGSVLTYLAVQDQHAGTDVTADLEEETHASEHAENAADELLVENLGTACTSGQVVASDGAGGLGCAASGGSSSYIELFYWLTGVGINNGYSSTTFAPGIWTNSLDFATGTNMQIGAAQFADVDAEIGYFRGNRLSAEKVTATNLSHVNFEAEVSMQVSTLADTVSFMVGVICISPGDVTNTSFASMSYTALAPMTGTSTGTPANLFILSSTDQDLTAGAGCAVGDVPIYKVEADETAAGMDNTVNFMTFRVWTD